jgi:prepilin-type N-terminal cleavage/methylation domain-containing protein
MPSKNNRQPKIQKAFTLIELLVVIAIVGILAGLAVVNMSGATEKARIVKAQNFAASIQHSMAASLAGEWNFDGQNANDSSGNNNNGTISGAVTTSTTSYGDNVVGQYAMSFDGVDDYVMVPYSDKFHSNSKSASLWFNALSSAAAAYPPRVLLGSWSHSGADRRGWAIIQESGSVCVSVGDASHNEIKSCYGVSLGKWHHVFFSHDYDSSKLYLYVDGNKVGDLNITGYYSTGNRLGVGTYPGGEPHWVFHGLIDEIRFYNVALSASAVREQYIAGLDRLLARDQITKKEYRQRLADLNLTYATNK